MRLLVIDDDPAQARALAAVLGRCEEGHEVTTAGSLAGAEAALAAGPFDVVLLDLTLPDGSGLASYERLAAAAPRTPVVVVTGSGEREVGRALIRAGAQEFLVKGQFDADGVCRAVQYAAIRHERQQLGRDLRAAAAGFDEAIARAGADERAEALRGIARQMRDLAGRTLPGARVQVESLPGGGAVVTVPPGSSVEVTRPEGEG